jgi:hypothetical protein
MRSFLGGCCILSFLFCTHHCTERGFSDFFGQGKWLDIVFWSLRYIHGTYFESFLFFFFLTLIDEVEVAVLNISATNPSSSINIVKLHRERQTSYLHTPK